MNFQVVHVEVTFFEIELKHITHINEIFVLFFEAAVLLCCWLEVLRNIIKARKEKSCKAIREFEVLTTEFYFIIMVYWS